jgi:Spy/CpxP family protein refolding chaperone
MQFRSRAALAVLALALLCSPVFAQDDPAGPPPPGEFAMRGPMGPMPGRDDSGGWSRMRGGFGRDGRMGMLGGFDGDAGRGAGLLRALRDPDIRKQVGVTDDQFAKIRQQESDFRKTEIRNRADLQIKRIDLRDLLAADKPDRSAIDSKLQEISASQLALEKSAVDFRLDMRDAITPAQREKLRQLMRDHRQRGEAGPGRPGGPQSMRRRGQGGSAAQTAPAPQANPQPAPPTR